MENLPPEIQQQIINLFQEEDHNDITYLATIEAMMTFMKLRMQRKNSERIIVPVEMKNDPDKLFHFARIYQNALLALYAGKLEVSDEVKEIFNEMPLRK